MESIRIEFREGKIFLKEVGKKLESLPLDWFPKLKNATPDQLNNFELSQYGIHWKSLDEDLSFEGFSKFNKNSLTV